MIYFFLSIVALVLGYFVYSKVIEKLFGANYDRKPPAITMADGVDYVVMPTWKLFMIQLLNIAGVGPVFGPIMGALYGPVALLWIVIGCIFAGAVHDYFAGMMSIRYNGKSVPDIVGLSLGKTVKQIMRVFSIILLLLVGVVFVTAPAGILASITPEFMGLTFWVVVIFIYYFLATILPIDVIIGRFYPIFAIILLIMAFGVAGGLIFKGYEFYNWAEFTNQHPKGLPIWPLLFVTISCGALSGFHATQSPLMSRCVSNERQGRLIFYGAMVAEGVIALIWATAGMTFYGSPELLQGAGAAAAVVKEVSFTLLGPVGGVLALLGVVVLPITSGDTAFRALRLVISDITKIDQRKPVNRLGIAVPLFIMGGILSQVDFNIIWRYFGWSNQALATIMLWAAAAYLVRRDKPHWFASIPAIFMTAVVFAFISYEKIGFSLPYNVAVGIGIISAIAVAALFLSKKDWFKKNVPLELKPGE